MLAYAGLPIGLVSLAAAWAQSDQVVAPKTVTAAVVAPATLAPLATITPTVAPIAPAPQASPALSTELVHVANTGGMGVYLRRTPSMDDKLRAYQDGTTLTIVGPDVVAGGVHWRHVIAPDQSEGYVPSEYLQPNP